MATCVTIYNPTRQEKEKQKVANVGFISNILNKVEINAFPAQSGYLHQGS